jgi:3-phosphoglycerate kinase
MTELLTFVIGLLVGGIIVYIYMRKKGIDLNELLADTMVKNKLLKEEIVRKPKPKKWTKKKYYGKKTNGKPPKA